ncbi:MAG: hypothetical protein IJW18_08785, partial [Lachnospiraceae bacterium]|nr:hypothetical protein [Lachnospiraceae bacterium]
RNILKEGMNMAREFGVRSYKPEDIFYIMGVERLGDKEQPKSIMEHKLYVNIMLEAYGNPASAEELSLELGVALPYMENELEYLVRETFLVKKDGRYQTAFPIINCSTQEKVHIACLTAAPEITKTLTNFVDRLNDAFKAFGYDYYGKYKDWESAKWTLIKLAYQHFRFKTPSVHGITERPNGGKWDVIGRQISDVKSPMLICNYVRRGEGYDLQHFTFGKTTTEESFISEEEARVIHDALTNGVKADDAEIADKLVAEGFLRREGSIYEPQILVMKIKEIKAVIEKMDEKLLSELRILADNASKKLEEIYHKIEAIVDAELPAVIREDAYQRRLALEECYFDDGYLFETALANDWLTSQDKVSKAVGVCVDII